MCEHKYPNQLAWTLTGLYFAIFLVQKWVGVDVLMTLMMLHKVQLLHTFCLYVAFHSLDDIGNMSNYVQY